ncbi:hypothetical protein BEL04_06560 [Mucilaginibacter sp. PPCGB 2223]|uniref:Wzz/FepE/Etk N-terminal domain-containing protein n=1 Tax=Mucilaginibacter sp. PPCGB 2223 TaxID=1886027 RepID=UPI00082706F2|nr:Wzz/FepE/Etk N-terminal domain-containing protein [Mucilaginibacter sp. PPCGB 2223]OCX53937.1 hypothetical protein BEL04_06560 [Mucilaginibacter sp. PPCGB 2223]
MKTTKLSVDDSAAKEEISIHEMLLMFRNSYRYLLSKWLAIAIVSLLGAISGLAYSIIKKPTYTANCVFVLEDNSKSGLLSQYAGLASMAGIDIGGIAGGGVFQGDNILELYKSRTMIEKTLLNKGNFNGRDQLLIERYIDFNKLRPGWKKSTGIDNISFNGDPQKFSRIQDSIVTNLVDVFNKKLLSIVKPDKKLNIINVSLTTEDELFSKIFTEQLVENVNQFYIQTKTKKAYQSVAILQHQADSVKNVLDRSINGVASAMDATPSANPNLLSLRVPSQKRQVDVQASSAMYAEIVKNLELARISLQQETPLIQIIDKPVLPLEIKKVGKVVGVLLGIVVGAFVACAYFLVKLMGQGIGM